MAPWVHYRHAMTTQKPITVQIRAALARRGLAPYALARALGYTQGAPIYRILSGEHQPTDETLQRIADALGTELVRPEVRFTPRAQ